MRFSRTSVQKAVTMAAAGAGLGIGSSAIAGVTYDLRFADGTHTKSIAYADVGNNYVLELWAVVSGTNGTSTDDGIQSSYVKLLSSQGSDAAILSGGVTGAAVAADFQSFTGTSPLHRNGSGSDLNGDGIIDWGSNSTSSADTNYLFARASGVVTGGGSVGNAIDPNTWEFKMVSFTVSLNAVNGVSAGTTTFNIVKPSSTAVTGVTYGVARVDGSNYNVSSTNQQGAYTSATGVTFVSSVPEPASIGLLGVAAVGLIGRRRK